MYLICTVSCPYVLFAVPYNAMYRILKSTSTHLHTLDNVTSDLSPHMYLHRQFHEEYGYWGHSAGYKSVSELTLHLEHSCLAHKSGPTCSQKRTISLAYSSKRSKL
jgi:hypothetical protein